MVRLSCRANSMSSPVRRRGPSISLRKPEPIAKVVGASSHVRSIFLALGVMFLAPHALLAQSASPSGFSRRPWVGLGLGWDSITVPQPHRGGLAASLSLDLPITAEGGVRAEVGRLWGGSSESEDVNIRFASVGLFGQQVLSGVSGCEARLFGGADVGLYSFDAKESPLEDPRKVGYAAFVGTDCATGRASFGFIIDARFIESPDRTVLPARRVVVFDLVFAIKFRL